MSFNRTTGEEVALAIDTRIQKVAQEVFTNSPANRTAFGRVSKVGASSYSVIINSHEYNNIKAFRNVGQLKVNQYVVCLIPNNQYSNMLIIGVTDGKQDANGSEVTLNGVSFAGQEVSFYAPENAGTEGLALIADENGVPTWSAQYVKSVNGQTGDITLPMTALVYDMTSADASLNWGYTSGISNGVTVSDKDFSAYDYIDVYVRRSSIASQQGSVRIDLKILNNNEYAGSNVYFSEYENALYVARISVNINSAKTTFTPAFQAKWANGFTNNDGFVYRIVGGVL